MPTIIRKKSKPYKWVVGSVPLNDVANVEKKLPRDYITEDGFGITQKCRDYLQPLTDLMEQGVVDPVVAEAFPIERAPDAHRYLSERKNIGKVVLTL